MKMMFKIFRNLGIGLLLLLIVFFLSYLVLRNNIHPVIPHQYYRSAQLSTVKLSHLIKHLRIKSVINLRGARPQKKWYRDEIKITRALGVKYYELKLKAYGLPTPKQLQRLVHFLQEAPKPVLIHCEGGADRTGLASAIIVLLNNGTLAKAEQQISVWYLAISPNSIGRRVLPFYKRWLKKRGLQSTRTHFLQWVNQTQLGG